jgi:hypothetical protein
VRRKFTMRQRYHRKGLYEGKGIQRFKNSKIQKFRFLDFRLNSNSYTTAANSWLMA